jgi:hypothetical protein
MRVHSLYKFYQAHFGYPRASTDTGLGVCFGSQRLYKCVTRDIPKKQFATYIRVSRQLIREKTNIVLFEKP